MTRTLHELDLCWSPPWPDEWWVQRKRWIASRIAEHEDVLDLGCGTAILAAYLFHEGHRGLYVGVDRDPNARLIAEERNNAEGHRSVSVLPGRLEVLDVAELVGKHWGEDEDLPVIVLEQVLEHLPGDTALDLLRSIPPGAHVLVLVSQPLYARSPSASTELVTLFNAFLSEDWRLEKVVESGRHEIRGWAYGIEGHRSAAR